MKKLGNIIKEFRESNSYSLREFSKICGISHTYIDKLEKGVDPRSGKPVEPTLDTLEKIAQSMNMTLETLLSKIGKINIKRTQSDNDDFENRDKLSKFDESRKQEFTTAEDAMKFILQQPSLMAFGGYDLDKMNDEELIEFANELLRQLKLISYKYKK